MSATTGIQPLNDYSTFPNDPAKVQALMDLIPNPDSTSSSGAQAGNNSTTGQRGMLDEMSPAAAAQLIVELAYLKANVS